MKVDIHICIYVEHRGISVSLRCNQRATPISTKLYSVPPTLQQLHPKPPAQKGNHRVSTVYYIYIY